MDILNSIYTKTVAQNEKNLYFWEEYLKNLKSINFELFSDKLTVPVMVPIGSRILFRGELKHTNEVTVSLGADYFAKCSLKQAEILRQHRIKDAQSKVNMFAKEKQYIENQMSFTQQNIYDMVGQEIVEVYSEVEDKEWREKHKENVRQYKLQSKNKEDIKDDVTDDEELWNRLEELELQEELENELVKMGYIQTEGNETNFVDSESFCPPETCIKDNENENENCSETENYLKLNEKSYVKHSESISDSTLWQTVLHRQNKLEQKLEELKQRENSRSKTEKDLILRLDKMEELDELEDEIDRLDDIINEDVEYSAEKTNNQMDSTNKIRHSVSFADENDCETLEITFKHSKVEPTMEPYTSEKGLQKPSDIYAAYKNLFSEGTSSILKKTSYESDNTTDYIIRQENEEKTLVDNNVSKTIIVKDIIEKEEWNSSTAETCKKRPTSLFKKKRMQEYK